MGNLISNHNCLTCFDRYHEGNCTQHNCPNINSSSHWYCNICRVWHQKGFGCPTLINTELYTVEDYKKDKKNSLEKQVDGDHYKKYPIQPAFFSYKNKLGWHEGEIIKYVTRHRDKNGRVDLEKAIHLIEMLIELEYED